MSKSLERITYVEDEPDIRAVAELALTAVGGFAVDICASGQEALQKVESFKPDLILLDVMMPGMDGTETLRRLRELPSLDDVPVVFMTAKAQKQEVEAYKRLGAVEVIPKPFDPMALAGEISAIWDRYNLDKVL